MAIDVDREIANRKKETEDIFISMVVDKLSKTNASDLQKEIKKMSFSIVNTIWNDKKLNDRILLYIYGDGENTGTDEINYDYQSGMLYIIQEAIERSIIKIVLEHIIKEGKK